MPQNDIAIPVRYYVRLMEMLRDEGINTRALLARARIRSDALEQPNAMLRHSQVERLIGLATEESGRTDLGFELGRSLIISTHSIVGFGMLNSPNLERSIQFITRFMRLVTPMFGMRYEKGSDHSELHFLPAIGMSKLFLNFHLECIAAATHRAVFELQRDIPRYQITLSIAEPPHANQYRQLDNVRWVFDERRRPGVSALFDYRLSDYALAMADRNALAMAEERCRALLDSVAAKGGFKDWVTMMLREAGKGQPTLLDLAAILNLSPRTLDRYLKREGTGFRELALHVQHELACRHLANHTMSITEIAYSLGYSDAANFTRAFRAQAGCSPREFRSRH